MYKHSLNQLLRLVIVIAVCLSVGFFLKYTFVYLYPFFLAVLLSFLIHPLVTFLERKVKVPRAIATLIILITVFAIIIGSIILIITEFIQGTTYLAEKIPAHFKSFIIYAESFLESELMPIYHKITGYLHMLDPSQQDAIHDHLQQFTNQITTTGTAFLQNLLFKIPTVLRVLPSSMTVITFIILATFFITKDWYSLQKKSEKIIPKIANHSGKKIGDHLKKAFIGFLKAQMILIAITALTIFTGLTIMQVNHALTIAALTAVVDLLPYIGTGIVFIPWIIYLFITANYKLTIGISILYMVVIIGRQIIEPKLLSSTIGLHPLAILVAVFLGMQLWGFAGILAAPILLVLLNALHQAGVFRQIWRYIKG